jgi:hypothetical protein
MILIEWTGRDAGPYHYLILERGIDVRIYRDPSTYRPLVLGSEATNIEESPFIIRDYL